MDLGGEDACYAHLLDEGGALDERTISFTLGARPPFRLDLTAWTLRRRHDNVVDRWDADGSAYERVFPTSSGPVDVRVTQIGPADDPSLQVTVRGATAPSPAVRSEVGATLERSLGLGADVSGFLDAADDDPFLGPLAQRFRGVHPPRFHDWNEALTAAVSCQQLSLLVGIRLLNRLAERFGRTSPGGRHAFPAVADLAVLSEDDLRDLGYSTRKAQVITDIARGLDDGSVVLDDLESAPDAAAVARLCELRGIGRWSAEYVLLRGMGRVNVFPGDDVGAQNRLRRLMGIDSPLDHSAVRDVLARWEPWTGLVYFHLLLDGLADAGHVAPGPVSP